MNFQRPRSFSSLCLAVGFVAVFQLSGQAENGELPTQNASSTVGLIQLSDREVQTQAVELHQKIQEAQRLFQESRTPKFQSDWPGKQKHVNRILKLLDEATLSQRQLQGDTSYGEIFLKLLRVETERELGQWRTQQAPDKALPIRLRMYQHKLAETKIDLRKRTRLCVESLQKTLNKQDPWLGLCLLEQARGEIPTGKIPVVVKLFEQAETCFKPLNQSRNSLPFLIRNAYQKTFQEGWYELARFLVDQGLFEPAQVWLDKTNNADSGFATLRNKALKAKLAELQDDDNAISHLNLMGAATWFKNESIHLSAQDQLLVSQQLREMLFSPYLSCLGNLGRQVTPNQLAFQYDYGVSFWKGIAFTEQSRINAERHHPSLAPLFGQLNEVNQRIASAVASGQPALEWNKRKASLEREIAIRRDRIPKYMAPPPSVNLPEQTTLLDFYEFDTTLPAKGKNKPHQERRLSCFVIQKGNALANGRPAPVKVEFHDLGPMKPLADALTKWRQAIERGRGGPIAQPPELLPQFLLRERLWEPLTKNLPPDGLVLISPDGVLGQLPFAALPGAKPGTNLIEERGLVFIPAPRLLQPLQSISDKLSKPQSERKTDLPEQLLVMGNIDYREPPASVAKRFLPLPGTVMELRSIEELWHRVYPQTKVRVLEKDQATEKALRTHLPNCRWLHVATHGYVQPDAGKEIPAALRAGLALSGANLPVRAGHPDGVITPLEVMTLDAAPVELVCLSACETGLGVSVQGEGLLSLQSAFLTAGSRSVLSSHWQVPDHPTAVLMVRFYENLWVKKMSRLEALREAQMWMIRQGANHRGIQRGMIKRHPKLAAKENAPLPPYYWAAFTLSGSWK